MLNNLYHAFLKRTFDFIASLLGIIILSPIFLIVSIIIKLTSKGPVLFIQERMGYKFKKFKLYKFRTMVNDAHKKGPGITSGDDPRITTIGKIIRKFKIDELPQLFNVLKGEMSLVGSRPEIEHFVNYYKDDFREILRFRPGITDFASIKYRNENKLLNSIENREKYYKDFILRDKISLYKKYNRSSSMVLDIKIIIATVFGLDSLIKNYLSLQ